MRYCNFIHRNNITVDPQASSPYFSTDANAQHQAQAQYLPDDPYFIVDLTKIQDAYGTWINHLPRVTPYYAMKCNPDPVIVELLALLGVNFDCASEAELHQALSITKDPTKIIFANPCKVPSHLDYARANSISRMTFDCTEELHKIKARYPEAELILRLAVDDSKSACKFNKKFGCPPANVNELLKTASNLNLNVIGFSFHVGSGCTSADVYYSAISACKDATILADKYGFNTRIIDIGGGFVGNDTPLFTRIAAEINKAIDTFFSDRPGVRFISEPGRYFVQTSHTLFLSIIGKKGGAANTQPIYYVNDGIYGSLNCIVFDHQRPELRANARDSTTQPKKSIIFGPTCDSIDIITEDAMLPDLNIGDRLYIENFGAYTTAAASEFNGFKTTKKKYIISPSRVNRRPH